MVLKQLGKPVAVRGVSKLFGAVRALDDVTLDIGPGEFCTLLGASGSGKTTLLKSIAGFETCDFGEILVGGVDIGPIPVSKRNIGMVFQNYALFPHLSVRRNVSFGLEMRGLGRAEIDRRTEAALGLVSLGDLADRMPRALSGGQQQRVALARALVIEPDILLMDEPLGALDKNLRQAIQLQLKDLHAEIGATIIYVTHDQEEALFLSDRIVLMDRGRVVQVGRPEELYFAPANRFVAGFLGDCNFIAVPGQEEIAIRPERMLIGAAAAAAEVSLSALVRSVIFIGTGYRVVMTAQGREIAAITGHQGDVARLERGTETLVGFDRRHAMIFRD